MEGDKRFYCDTCDFGTDEMSCLNRHHQSLKHKSRNEGVTHYCCGLCGYNTMSERGIIIT